MPRNRWRVRDVDADTVQRIAGACGISPALATVLMGRGVSRPDEAARFLRAGVEDLHDPYRLTDMSKAVERIRRAIAGRELIRVWGDYDADGLSGAALLVRLLRSLGAEVDVHVPHRLSDGYGLNADGVRQAVQDGVRLLVTVDSGTTAVEPIRALQQAGVDVVVVDHHQPRCGQPSAPAFALLNPKRSDAGYPDQDLTASGVAFKCAQALCRHDPAMALEHLDLACIGTISDLGPLTGENRVMVKQGLLRLGSTAKPGLQALLGETASGRRKRLSATSIGCEIAPRLNAAGRLGSAEAALRLLLTESVEEAKTLVARLEADNRDRRDVQKMILGDALRLVEQQVNFRDHRVIVLASERWHPGVVGIVAARLADRFRRPVVLLAEEKDRLRGSGRSANGFSLFEALAGCEELLEEYGGHHAACGMTLRRTALEPLRNRLNAIAAERGSATSVAPEVDLDAALTLGQVTEPLLEELEQLAPFGQGNPRPRFVTYGAQVSRPFEPSGRSAARGWVGDGSAVLEAVAPIPGDDLDALPVGSRWDIVYTPALRSSRGHASVRLEVSDLQPAG